MMLHDAIRYARMELGLSQKKLAEQAGIQRRQLATLEKGGNVTLATVRKVLAHLPNLERFSLDTVQVDVDMQTPAAAVDIKQVSEAIQMMGRALQRLGDTLEQGTQPTDEDTAILEQAKVKMFSGMPMELRLKALGDQAADYPDLMNLPVPGEEEGDRDGEESEADEGEQT